MAVTKQGERGKAQSGARDEGRDCPSFAAASSQSPTATPPHTRLIENQTQSLVMEFCSREACTDVDAGACSLKDDEAG